MRNDADILQKGVKNRAIQAQKLLDDLTDQNPFVTIFLLDCCRKYYLRNANLEKLGARAVASHTKELGGLKEMHDRTGSSLIAFACAPGAIADDMDGKGRNGLFTKYLLEHIGTPNEDIRMILADVTNDVMQESGKKQLPYCHSILRHKHIYLNEQDSGKACILN